MAITVYASFASAEDAERATGALLDEGVRPEDVSLVAKRLDPPPAAPVHPVQELKVGPESEVDRAGDTALYAEPRPIVPPAAATPAVRPPPVVDDTRSRDIENQARTGITTTTGKDAAAGALKGAGIGLALGVAGAAAAVLIPGFGLVLGSGALAAAIGATAATTGAGMIAGGLTGYLRDQGVPEHAASTYEKAVAGGGALVAVHGPSDNVDLGTIERILEKYGAASVARH